MAGDYDPFFQLTVEDDTAAGMQQGVETIKEQSNWATDALGEPGPANPDADGGGGKGLRGGLSGARVGFSLMGKAAGGAAGHMITMAGSAARLLQSVTPLKASFLMLPAAVIGVGIALSKLCTKDITDAIKSLKDLNDAADKVFESFMEKAQAARDKERGLSPAEIENRGVKSEVFQLKEGIKKLEAERAKAMVRKENLDTIDEEIERARSKIDQDNYVIEQNNKIIEQEKKKQDLIRGTSSILHGPGTGKFSGGGLPKESGATVEGGMSEAGALLLQAGGIGGFGGLLAAAGAGASGIQALLDKGGAILLQGQLDTELAAAEQEEAIREGSLAVQSRMLEKFADYQAQLREEDAASARSIEHQKIRDQREAMNAARQSLDLFEDFSNQYIKNQKAKLAIDILITAGRAAMNMQEQLALAWGMLYENPPGAAAHFISAGLFAALAAGKIAGMVAGASAGGSGSGGGSSAYGGTASSGSEGPRVTNVVIYLDGEDISSQTVKRIKSDDQRQNPTKVRDRL